MKGEYCVKGGVAGGSILLEGEELREVRFSRLVLLLLVRAVVRGVGSPSCGV